MTIAIQGQPGSFHDQATQTFFTAKNFELACCETFSQVFDKLGDEKVEFGVVAVENSLYGSLHETYDRITECHFPVVGEVVLGIHQQLVVHPRTNSSDVTEIISHPAALDQCRSYLEKNFPHAELVEFHDTAGAVEHIKQHKLVHAAAIASAAAARLHDMAIIAENIEDEPDNITRFVVIATKPETIPHANKASLILRTSHKPGALWKALGVFATHGCNLTKLESRPVRGERFQYQFLVDVLADQDTLFSVITELEQQNCRVTLLGHYRAAV